MPREDSGWGSSRRASSRSRSRSPGRDRGRRSRSRDDHHRHSHRDRRYRDDRSRSRSRGRRGDDRRLGRNDDRDGRRDTRAGGGGKRKRGGRNERNASAVKVDVGLHPCVTIFGKCQFQDMCAFAFFPGDACMNFLKKGACADKEKRGSKCKKSHYEAKDPRYQNGSIGTGGPTAGALLDKQQAGTRKSGSKVVEKHPCVALYGYCLSKENCNFASFPGDACVDFLKAKCAGRKAQSCQRTHYDRDDPRYQNETTQHPCLSVKGASDKTSTGAEDDCDDGEEHEASSSTGGCRFGDALCPLRFFPRTACYFHLLFGKCNLGKACLRRHDLKPDDPKFRNPEATAIGNAIPKFHPCLTLGDDASCEFGDECHYACFPSDACTFHLRGMCVNTGAETAGEGAGRNSGSANKCPRRHYDPLDPRYQNEHTLHPCLIKDTKVFQGFSGSRAESLRRPCTWGNAKCPFLKFPRSCCLQGLLPWGCNLPGCTRRHDIKKDDPRFQNPSATPIPKTHPCLRSTNACSSSGSGQNKKQQCPLFHFPLDTCMQGLLGKPCPCDPCTWRHVDRWDPKFRNQKLIHPCINILGGKKSKKATTLGGRTHDVQAPSMACCDRRKGESQCPFKYFPRNACLEKLRYGSCTRLARAKALGKHSDTAQPVNLENRITKSSQLSKKKQQQKTASKETCHLRHDLDRNDPRYQNPEWSKKKMPDLIPRGGRPQQEPKPTADDMQHGEEHDDDSSSDEESAVTEDTFSYSIEVSDADMWSDEDDDENGDGDCHHGRKKRDRGGEDEDTTAVVPTLRGTQQQEATEEELFCQVLTQRIQYIQGVLGDTEFVRQFGEWLEPGKEGELTQQVAQTSAMISVMASNGEFKQHLPPDVHSLLFEGVGGVVQEGTHRGDDLPAALPPQRSNVDF